MLKHALITRHLPEVKLLRIPKPARSRYADARVPHPTKPLAALAAIRRDTHLVRANRPLRTRDNPVHIGIGSNDPPRLISHRSNRLELEFGEGWAALFMQKVGNNA